MRPFRKHDLQRFVRERLAETRLIVVSNRQPYIHRYSGSVLECVRPASGMISALDPVLSACGGTWVAHGGGSADREVVDRHNRTQVPPEAPRYTLRRVWLTKQQEAGYYYSLANEAIWPLCHVVFTPPKFDPEAWKQYTQVNRLFADVVLEEAGNAPALVFVQDFHLALLPRFLKNDNPNLTIALFWHIPWPNPETFRVFPWAEQLLDGLLGNDLLSFHQHYHCLNFLQAVGWHVEAKVDQERGEVTKAGHQTIVRAYPIGVDAEGLAGRAESAAVAEQMQRWRQQLGLRSQLLGIGVDRLDYTKGIPQRLRAIGHFLETHPEFRRKFLFVQVGVPSRTRIGRYQALMEEVESVAEEINWVYGDGGWQPIVLWKQQEGIDRLVALYRLASFCLVTSLHDGMNLVAKEFVASRIDGDGVLILSRFAGAAHELSHALLVNPYSLEDTAAAIHQALSMPEPERHMRMQLLRETVFTHTVYDWAGRLLADLLRVGYSEDTVSGIAKQAL